MKSLNEEIANVYEKIQEMAFRYPIVLIGEASANEISLEPHLWVIQEKHLEFLEILELNREDIHNNAVKYRPTR